jgi:hypothetical protein
MNRRKIPQETKVRATLQQEIASACPFCKDISVGHFQIHHIDENPSNNELNNLILVCPNCHSKITKNDISKIMVIRKKKELMKDFNQNLKYTSAPIFNINSPVKESIIGNVENIYLNPINVNRQIIRPTEIHITQEQASMIKKLIDDIIDIKIKAGKLPLAGMVSKAYQNQWTAFKNRFNITSYHLLPKEKYLDAETWLYQQVAQQKPKLRKTNRPEWRKRLYASIYARLNNLAISKDSIYDFAFHKFDLKKPITSLTELNDTNLKKLDQFIYSKWKNN